MGYLLILPDYWAQVFHQVIINGFYIDNLIHLVTNFIVRPNLKTSPAYKAGPLISTNTPPCCQYYYYQMIIPVLGLTTSNPLLNHPKSYKLIFSCQNNSTSDLRLFTIGDTVSARAANSFTRSVGADVTAHSFITVF